MDANVDIAKVDIEQSPDNGALAQQYGVQGIPTMLMMKDGKIVHRQVGALPEPMLKDTVAQFLDVVATKG